MIGFMFFQNSLQLRHHKWVLLACIDPYTYMTKKLYQIVIIFIVGKRVCLHDKESYEEIKNAFVLENHS